MKKFLKLYLLSFILLSDFVAFAQPGSEASGGGLEGTGDPQPAPINSKIMFLAIAGVLFVIYTFRKNRRIA